jgi:hypothetical protein
MFEMDLNEDASETFMSLWQGGAIKIVRMNVTDPNNIYKLGEYRWTGQFGVTQSYVFYSTHIYKNYLIGCSDIS